MEKVKAALAWMKKEWQFLSMMLVLVGGFVAAFGFQLTTRQAEPGEKPGVVIIVPADWYATATPDELNAVIEANGGEAVWKDRQEISPRTKAVLIAVVKLLAVLSPNQYDNMLVELLERLWKDPESLKRAYTAVTGKAPLVK